MTFMWHCVPKRKNIGEQEKRVEAEGTPLIVTLITHWRPCAPQPCPLGSAGLEALVLKGGTLLPKRVVLN